MSHPASTKRASAKPDRSTLFTVILGSTTIWLALLLVLTDAAIKCERPLRFVSMGAYIASDQNPLFPKFDALLHANDKIDVLLLGSSLVMAAAYNADEKSGFSVPRQLGYDRASYTGAATCQKVFKDKLGRQLNVFNFAGPSCMISDSYMVLSSAIATGHAPRAVCIGVAPRDFIDNMVGPINKSVYFDFFEKQGLGLNAKKDQTFAETVDRFLSRTCHFYRVRADYKALFELAGADILHRSTSLYAAVHKANGIAADPSAAEPALTITFVRPTDGEYQDKVVSADMMKKSLNSYSNQYLPLNWTRYQAELAYFQKLHQLCQKNGIELLVVNMPLTQENQQLLPVDFKRDYAEKVANYCTATGITFVDLNDTLPASASVTASNNGTVHGAFQNNDFNDSAHVNGQGGIKIWHRLADALSTTKTGFFSSAQKRQLAVQANQVKTLR